MGHADHGIHRCADFVAHVGEEVGLCRGSHFGGRLCLFRRALGLLERRDVDDDADQATWRPIRGAEATDRVKRVSQPAIGVLHLNFTRHLAALCDDHLVFSLIGRAYFCRNIVKIKNPLADELVAVNPKEALIGLVAAQETGIRAFVENGVGNGVEQGLQKAELANQFGFDLPAVCDIENGDQQGVEFSVFVADGGNLDITPGCIAARVDELEFLTEGLALPGSHLGQYIVHPGLYLGGQEDVLRVRQQCIDGLIDKAGKSGVDQGRYALRGKADDADRCVVEDGSEKRFAFFQDVLALPQGMRSPGDLDLQFDLGVFLGPARALQVLAHAFDGRSKLGDFAPRRIGGDRLFKFHPANAGAFIGEGIERFAKAPGDVDGDRHAQGKNGYGNKHEQQQIFAGDRDKIFFRCDDAKNDAAGLNLKRTEEAYPASVRAVKFMQAPGRGRLCLPQAECLCKLG